MKQQLEGEELVHGLYEVKNLLIAMDNVNKKELQVRAQLRQTLPAQNNQLKKSTKKGGWIALLATAFVLMTLFFSAIYAPRMVADSKRAYEKALVDDEFNWSMQHMEDGAAYPGYNGSVEEPITFGTAYGKALPRAGIVALVLVIIAGAVIFSVQKSKNVMIDKENKRRTEQYQAVLAQNNQIIANNQKLQAQIEAFNQRRQAISREYLTNLCKWYHEDYAFMDAVNYFIREIELGTATTLPEAIKNFREAQFRREVVENQKTMIENQKIMINNQEIMISKQDEMIRQQMLGNIISAATLVQTTNIANSVSNIESNTSRAAKYAGDIAWNTRER